MADQSMVATTVSTKKQFLFLIRKLGGFSKRPVLDVSESGEWHAEVVRRGGSLQSIVDDSDQESSEHLLVGSPAGSIGVAAHTMQRILVRDSLVFRESNVTPEMTIALANLLSSLKSRGKLVIPVAGDIDVAKEVWKARLAGLPGKMSQRVYKTGLLSYLNLTFLMRGIHNVQVLEFTVDRKVLSRLEWHRLAREAVMQRMQQSSAAA